MMHVSPPPIKVRLAILTLVVLVVLAFIFWQAPVPWQTTAPPPSIYSGTVEADQTLIACEFGGRLVDLSASEGSIVAKGDLLARLDDGMISAQIEQTRAAVATARAKLVLTQAGSRPEDIAAQRATLAQAIAAREGAKDAWESTLRARDNPRDLDIRVEGARSAVRLAGGQVTIAQAALETARVQRDRDRNVQALSLQVTAAEAGVAVAEAALVRSEAQLAALLDLRDHPLTAQSQVTLADTAYQFALAAADAAQARLDALLAGPTAQDLALARAGVDQAEAGLAILALQREKLTIRSPLDGLVVANAAQLGELVAPGAPIMTVADLSRLYLTVFVPEDEVGRVYLGRQASVSVDAYPGRAIAGSVSYISSRAEFTPKSVQTQKERVSTVFAVRIRLGTGELILKPGMPADAILTP
jgi:HlyD family secretion protein